jgi:N-acetylglucosamine kinase-like BadF-type ATPase
MTSPPDIVAVDGGNSKLDVALVAADGTLLGAARGSGAAFTPDEQTESIAVLTDTVRRAYADAGLDADAGPRARLGVLCLAGADLPIDDRRLLRALRPRRLADEIVLHNDTFAVLRAGTERSWGIGVVCGTGMNCSGVAPNGRCVRFAALGEESGDDGGGGWLGRAAIRAAVRGWDLRDAHTALEKQVPAFYGVRSPMALLELIQMGRVDRYAAELAPLVFRCAGTGDVVAQALLDHQADEIVAMVVSAVRRLHLTRRDVDVVLGGGLFRSGDRRFNERIERGILAIAPAARTRQLLVPPVVGAALLGLDRLGAEPGAHARIRSTLTHERLSGSRKE